VEEALLEEVDEEHRHQKSGKSVCPRGDHPTLVEPYLRREGEHRKEKNPVQILYGESRQNGLGKRQLKEPPTCLILKKISKMPAPSPVKKS
jgi:hypothetical protein